MQLARQGEYPEQSQALIDLACMRPPAISPRARRTTFCSPSDSKLSTRCPVRSCDARSDPGHAALPVHISFHFRDLCIDHLELARDGVVATASASSGGGFGIGRPNSLSASLVRSARFCRRILISMGLPE